MVQLFSHWLPWNTVVRVVLETVFLILSVVLAVAALSPDALRGLVGAFPPLLFFVITTFVVNAALGLYQPTIRRSSSEVAIRVSASLLLALPIAYVAFHYVSRDLTGDSVFQLSALAAIASHALIRGYGAKYRDRSVVFANRILVVGAGPEAATVAESLCKHGPEFRIVGFYPVSGAGTACVPAQRLLDGNKPLAEMARENRVDQIVVAVGDRRGGVLPLDQLLDCKVSGIKVVDFSTYFEQVFGQVRLDSLRASWLIFGEGFRQGFVRTLVKRAFDVLASAVLLLLATPVMVVTAILIALESGMPIFYRQERVGQGGRVFHVIKFRSMRNDAERDGRPRWASSNDDRVTRVGKVIRKLRIDELPQLFNVLNGDMSLVGPRPERPFFVDQLSEKIPFYSTRHSIKPGVTGWAQVRYAYGASVEDSVQKLQYDLYYVKNHSLFLDFMIFLETVEVVLTGRGAQ